MKLPWSQWLTRVKLRWRGDLKFDGTIPAYIYIYIQRIVLTSLNGSLCIFLSIVGAYIHIYIYIRKKIRGIFLMMMMTMIRRFDLIWHLSCAFSLPRSRESNPHTHTQKRHQWKIHMNDNKCLSYFNEMSSVQFHHGMVGCYHHHHKSHNPDRRRRCMGTSQEIMCVCVCVCVCVCMLFIGSK